MRFDRNNFLTSEVILVATLLKTNVVSLQLKDWTRRNILYKGNITCKYLFVSLTPQTLAKFQ